MHESSVWRGYRESGSRRERELVLALAKMAAPLLKHEKLLDLRHKRPARCTDVALGLALHGEMVKW